MGLSERLTNDLKDALKKGDTTKVSILRMVMAAIKNREIEKRASLNEEELNSVLRSFVKQGKESIEQFSRAGRADLVEKETVELQIIQSYLPAQLTEDEIDRIVKDTIKEVGAEGLRDVGKVMKTVMAKVGGRADGKFINELVRKRLGG